MENDNDGNKFSPNFLVKKKFGDGEKNFKTAKSTKRANKKVGKQGGKYITKIVGGVKYMVLNPQYTK